MKRSVLAAGVVAAALGVVGCTGNTDTQISGSINNPCTGETVDFSGVLHNNFSGVPDGQGGFNVNDHFNLQDVKGVGETTGTTYIVTAGQATGNDLRFHITPNLEATLQIDVNVISKGSASNFLIHTLVHVTVTPNGDFTANVSNGGTKCTG